MDTQLFILFFIGFGLFYLIVGLLVSRGIKNVKDYFLAGRDLGLGYLTFTLIATQVGGGMLLGSSEQSYQVGYFGVFYTLGIALGFLFLGLGFAPKLRSFNVSTTAQLFETKYGSVFLKKIASLLSIVTLFGILGAQVIGIRGVLLGLGIDNNFAFILFWLFIIIYTMIGGLRAVAVTDFFQIIFILIIFGGVFLYSLSLEPVSFFSINNLVGIQKPFSSIKTDFFALFPIVFNPMMFAFVEQDLAQRFFAAKTKNIAASSALLASIFMVLFSCVPIYFGMKAKLLGLNIPSGANPLVVFLNYLSSGWFISLVVCALAAAVTSTSDSLLCAISSNICQDFNLDFWGVRNKLRASQIITFIVGLLALLVGYFCNDIIGLLVQSYGLSISSLFVPVFFCFFKKKLNKKAAFLSMVLGGMSFLLFQNIYLPIPKELATLVISLLGYFVGECF
ncbi:sodium:solute symporter family protein [Candidatus Dependentiae bacterium]